MENIENGNVVTRYFPSRKRNLLTRMTQMSTYEHMNRCLSFKNVRMRFTNGILENSFTIILENCKHIHFSKEITNTIMHECANSFNHACTDTKQNTSQEESHNTVGARSFSTTLAQT